MNNIQKINELIHGADVIEKATDGVQLTRGDKYEISKIKWLWQNWLAQGKLHLLAGAPGQGKTTIAISFAATVTSGGAWPDGSDSDSGNVLIWSGEDEPSDTLLPRFIASGGDSTKLFFVSGVRVDGQLQPFDPSRDMQSLKEHANEIGNIKLIIVDPIVNAVTGDSHKNTETRRSLQPLVDLASSMGAALLGITHFAKGGRGVDPAQRVIGSVAFIAIARVVLVAAKVIKADGLENRVLARSKSNIGPDSGGYEYNLIQTELQGGIYASYVAWGDLVEGSAQELLAEPKNIDEEESSARDSAKDFLKQVLEECPVSSKVVETEAKQAGFSWSTIKRASNDLKIIKKRAAEGKWYWGLSKSLNLVKNGHVAQLVQEETLSNLGNLGNMNNSDNLTTNLPSNENSS